MVDSDADTETDEEQATETHSETDRGVETAETSVLDFDSAEAYERRVDELADRVEEQAAEIAELEDLLLDLSVRQADDRGMGVCPECHGPVEKVRRWFHPTTIECRRCGEVFHEY